MASVLIVHDDSDARDVVTRYLSKAGHVVRDARSGREALIAVAVTIPDVIILDVRMPEMDGIEFLQVIRSYLRWSSIPVILLTAYDHPETLLQRAHALGARITYIKTTYRLEELAECVNRLSANPYARCEGSGGRGA
jgi:CheY-like chemotaxis protein